MEKTMTMADVLNQSWGGPDFPSYEGRLEGDTMDSGERAEAALAAFSGDDSASVDPAPQADDQGNAGGDDQGADDQSNAREQNAGDDVPEGQLTEEQLHADPRFQALSTLKDEITNAFSDFPGLLDDKGNINTQEAALQLKDASILYDIMQGKGTPSALLEVMAQNAGWTAGQKQAIANDLIGWLTKSGFLKDGQAAGKDAKGGTFKDPIQERLDKIENDRKAEQQRAEQERIVAHQKQVFETKFLPQVEKLCTQKGVPKEDVPFYVDKIAASIKGNKAIIGRIENNNFVDLQKFFAQIHNSEVQRLQRWTKAQTAAAEKKEKNPKIPAGGAPPHPAGSAKTVKPGDRDSRIAAASELF